MRSFLMFLSTVMILNSVSASAWAAEKKLSRKEQVEKAQAVIQGDAAQNDTPDLSGSTVTISEPFKPDAWADGVHLLAGLGVNTSVFNDVRTYRDFGLGSNFKADVGYYWGSRFAVELSSDVKFNWVDELLVWDTLFTLGFRYRFESLFSNKDSNFVRVFAGAAPTVIFLNGTQPALQAAGASRVQFNGPVVGLGAGRMNQTSSGRNWFIEWAISYQWLQTQEVIKDASDVPIVVSSGSVTNQSKIFSAFLNIGLLVF